LPLFPWLRGSGEERKCSLEKSRRGKSWQFRSGGESPKAGSTGTRPSGRRRGEVWGNQRKGQIAFAPDIGHRKGGISRRIFGEIELRTSEYGRKENSGKEKKKRKSCNCSSKPRRKGGPGKPKIGKNRGAEIKPTKKNKKRSSCTQEFAFKGRKLGNGLGKVSGVSAP